MEHTDRVLASERGGRRSQNIAFAAKRFKFETEARDFVKPLAKEHGRSTIERQRLRYEQRLSFDCRIAANSAEVFVEDSLVGHVLIHDDEPAPSFGDDEGEHRLADDAKPIHQVAEGESLVG